MNINLFFILILAFLAGMFAYFTPNYTSDINAEELPRIELASFTLYEISPQGVQRILKGKEGKVFDNRYEISSANLRDNTYRLTQTIGGHDARYENDLLTLEGDIRFTRADGLEFRSHEARYNTDTGIVTTRGKFTITQSANRVEGEKLYYNSQERSVSADAVRGSYQFD